MQDISQIIYVWPMSQAWSSNKASMNICLNIKYQINIQSKKNIQRPDYSALKMFNCGFYQT